MWARIGNRFDDLFDHLGAPLRRVRERDGAREFSIRTVVLGVAMVISLLSLAEWTTGNLMVIGSFGASSILVFTVPDSEFAQPWNVVGGHVLSSLVGLVALHLFGGVWWSVGPTVGVALWVMLTTRSLHPPAGADPIIMIARQSTDPAFVVTTILGGTVVMVLLAVVWHGRVSGMTYPDTDTR